MQRTGAVTGGTTVLIPPTNETDPFMGRFPCVGGLMSKGAGFSKMLGSGATGADTALAPPLWFRV